jgi:hypothetical protein
MVPLTPEVKRIARLEHDRRQAECRFADRREKNFCALASEAVNARPIAPGGDSSGFVRCGNRTPNHAESDFPANVLSVVNPGSEPWTGPAGGAPGQQVKLAHFGTSKRNRSVTHLRGEQAKSAAMPAARPIRCLNNFPNPAFGGAGTNDPIRARVHDAARICLSYRTMISGSLSSRH